MPLPFSIVRLHVGMLAHMLRWSDAPAFQFHFTMITLVPLVSPRILFFIQRLSIYQ
jgi:hypothetical protein